MMTLTEEPARETSPGEMAAGVNESQGTAEPDVLSARAELGSLMEQWCGLPGVSLAGALVGRGFIPPRFEECDDWEENGGIESRPN